jgi:hypothetical protein
MKALLSILTILFNFSGFLVILRPSIVPAKVQLLAHQAYSNAAIPTWHWEPLTLPTGVSVNEVANLAISPTNAYVAFLATTKGLYRTTNAGQTWSRIASSTFSYVAEVVIASNNPQRLYARSDKLYRSDNGGDTWNLIESPPSLCGLSIAPSNTEIIYARSCGGSSGPAVFRSNNGGQTWIVPNNSFRQVLDTLVVGPANPNLLIATDFDQVFRSTDSGATWAVVPIGTRYFGRPVFEPQSPYTLYLGHWSGLLRSTDSGETWQDSDTDREFITLVASPFAANTVLSGNNEATWRVTSSNVSWNITLWDAPTPLQWLGRSVSDNRVLYARTETRLWRYIYVDLIISNKVFLPVILDLSQTVPDGPALQALDRANLYRAHAGVIPLQLHSAIVTAAQNHANYHMLNSADLSAWTYGAHGEVEGKPYYTGRWPSNRISAAGFPWFGGSEVMHFIGDPTESVDGWMATIYHRAIILDPGAHYTGYGNGRNSQTAVDVMDFGGGPTDQGVWSSAMPYPLPCISG